MIPVPTDQLPAIAAEAGRLLRAGEHDAALASVYDALNVLESTPNERAFWVLILRARLFEVLGDPVTTSEFADVVAQCLGCHEDFQAQVGIFVDLAALIRSHAERAHLSFEQAAKDLCAYLPVVGPN
jgi:hypothetical protein